MNSKKRKSVMAIAILGLVGLASLPLVAQPILTTQPSNQFLAAAKTVAFSVSATGTPPLSYQWLFDEAALPNATNSSIAVTNPVPAQWGYYSVVVSNASGAVTSQVAELKIFTSAPHGFSGIEAQPGGSMSLSFAGETSSLFAPYFDIYPLETSTNLLDWTPLAMLQRTNSYLATLQFLDTNAPEFNHRFYRIPQSQLPTPDPAPTGPYPVGTFSMLLTNTLAGSRSNAHFMVTFWYPAVAKAGFLPAKYVEQAVVANEYDSGFSSQVEAFYSHSQPSAPIATNQAAYPVILYQPAYGGHRRENADKTEELASWGYIVVGMDTADTGASVLPNGQVVNGQTASTSLPGPAYLQALVSAIEGRLLDSEFVLNQLEILEAGGPPLGGRLDSDRVGVFGWSLGGATSAQLCLRDPRCKAGAAFDSEYFETNLLSQPLAAPWLHFDEDDLMPSPSIGLAYARPDDRLTVFNEQKTNAYWVKLASTVHGNFDDLGLVEDPTTLEGDFGMPLTAQILPGPRVSQIVRAYLLSFFNKFLLGLDDHLLDGPSPAFPEVIQFLSQSGAPLPLKYPTAALIQARDGNLYGTTPFGGASGEGAVFRVTTNGSLTTLASFNGLNGSHPAAALLQGADGNLYGTTQDGGTNRNHGTIFRVTTNGALTSLVSLAGTNGSQPMAELIQGTNGNFYGTTVGGGAGGLGTVFQMAPSGALTTLVSFNLTNGAAPVAKLLQGTNGFLYGTTQVGGNISVNYEAGYGAIFQLSPAGALSTLFAFTGSDGAAPSGGLVRDTNGAFFGATACGGTAGFDPVNGRYSFGVVFALSNAGSLTKLASLGGTNGFFNLGGLAQGADGSFYGTTAGGGPGGGGTVFKVNATGEFTTLVAFNGSNGMSPQAALIQAADGNFYGTTQFGGAGGSGTVFRMTPDGVLTTLVAFGSSTNSP